MKKTVQLDDILDEQCEEAAADLRELLEEWLADNPEQEDLPDLGNDLDYSGKVHELIDGVVSAMSDKQVKDTWYLYEDELLEAYNDAGIGTNPRENEGRTAIYVYIEQAISEKYNNEGDEWMEDWQSRQIKKEREPEVIRVDTGDFIDPKPVGVPACEVEEETNE